MCSSHNLKWFQGSSKISHYEVKWAEILRDGSSHIFSCFTKILDQSKIICEWCTFAKLFMKKVYIKKTSKQILKWSKYNLRELEGVWRFWRKNTLSRPSYKTMVCNHVLNTIQNIIWNTYIYVKFIYSIEFCIILKTYIHMQGPFCSTLTLTLILET